MSNSKDNLIDELANLLNETAEAHHKAFGAKNARMLSDLFGMQTNYYIK
ncbi:MAG: hypothetical protein M3250_06320 [Thermoproteota archaeon]|nr:hypothetical protein [Thermoproteota archaeon]